MKLWLDDLRESDKEWLHAYSVNQAIDLLLSHSHCTDMSLDHDLGEYYYDGGDGINLLDYMAEYNIWPDKIFIHSGNPIGRENMMRLIYRYGPYKRFTFNSAS